MISIPGSLSFAKLLVMSSAPAESTGDARYAPQDPFIHGNQRCPIKSRLHSAFAVCPFYVEPTIIVLGNAGLHVPDASCDLL